MHVLPLLSQHMLANRPVLWPTGPNAIANHFKALQTRTGRSACRSL